MAGGLEGRSPKARPLSLQELLRLFISFFGMFIKKTIEAGRKGRGEKKKIEKQRRAGELKQDGGGRGVALEN